VRHLAPRVLLRIGTTPASSSVQLIGIARNAQEVTGTGVCACHAQSSGAGVAGPDVSLLIGRRVESKLVGPIPGRVLTKPATQRIEDCQALSHQASGHLAEPVGAVEDGQVCP
jgi:hypothetical protein